MIVDCTGTVLTPGANGLDWLGNGMHDGVECCCDECDYLQCCLEDHKTKICQTCRNAECPRCVFLLETNE